MQPAYLRSLHKWVKSKTTFFHDFIIEYRQVLAGFSLNLRQMSKTISKLIKPTRLPTLWMTKHA